MLCLGPPLNLCQFPEPLLSLGFNADVRSVRPDQSGVRHYPGHGLGQLLERDPDYGTTTYRTIPLEVPAYGVEQPPPPHNGVHPVGYEGHGIRGEVNLLHRVWVQRGVELVEPPPALKPLLQLCI